MSKLKKIGSRFVWSFSLIGMALGLDIVLRHFKLQSLPIGIIVLVISTLGLGWLVEDKKDE